MISVQLPNNLTLEEVIDLRKKFWSIYDENLKTQPKLSNEVKQFNEIIFSKKFGIPKGTRPKDIEVILEQWYETLTKTPEYQENETEAPEYKEQTQTTLSEDELKQFQEEGIERETKREEIVSKTKERVREAIERKQEIKSQQDLLKRKIDESKKIETELKDSNNQDKKIYAKVEIKNPPKFTEVEQKAFEVYKKEIKSNPKETLKDISKTIEERITPELTKQGLKVEEIKLVSNQTATKIVENITQIDSPLYVSPMTQVAILDKVSKDTKVLPKIIVNKEALNTFQNSTNDITATSVVSEQVIKNISKMAFGETFTSTVFGVDPNQVEVTLSETQEPGYTNSINLDSLNQNYQHSLVDQNSTLETVKDLGINETKGFLYEKAGTYLEGKIASLAPESVAGKILQSTEAKSLFFSTFGVGTPVTWEATNWVGNLTLKFSPESAPLLSGLGKLTGINFGLTPVFPTATTGIIESTPIVTSIAEGVEGKIEVAAAGKVAGKGLSGFAAKLATRGVIGKAIGGAITSITTALGSVAPIIGHAIGFLIGSFVSKIIEKINWKKVKEYLLPTAAIGGGLLIGGPIGLTLIAGGGLVAAGVVRSGVGAGVFFARLGMAIGSISIKIATPVIITLLIIPPLVAFIMFVINSGAYLVPPSSLGSGADNPYMLVIKIAEPKKTSNPNPEIKVNYTVTITALKSTLTNIKVVSTKCTVIKKDKSVVKCPSEIIPDIDKDLIISPTKPYSFVFTSDYNSKYSDSIIYDSIEISADTPEEKGIITSGSATVCIGDCPTDCVKVSDNAQVWPSSLRSNSEVAVGTLVSQYQGFMAKVCSNNEEVNLCYNPSQITAGYYAWHIHNSFKDKCDVYFNQKGVGNSGDALFLITHELTHHIQKISGSSTSQYLSSGGYFELGGRGFCTYEDTAGGPSDDSAIAESMAEANGLYASIPSWGGCISNYATQYPKNYIFAQNFMR